MHSIRMTVLLRAAADDFMTSPTPSPTSRLWPNLGIVARRTKDQHFIPRLPPKSTVVAYFCVDDDIARTYRVATTKRRCLDHSLHLSVPAPGDADSHQAAGKTLCLVECGDRWGRQTLFHIPRPVHPTFSLVLENIPRMKPQAQGDLSFVVEDATESRRST